MRIAIIAEVFLPKIDGVVNRTVNLIRQLKGSGDDLMVVCPQAEGCTACAAQVVDVPSFSFPLYPEYRVGLPDQRLARAVKKFDPEVIHYINPFAFGFRCNDVFRKARLRAPTVFSFHTLYGEFVKQYKGLEQLSKVLWWLTREYHNRADLNLTVSSAMQEDLVRRGFHRVELWPPAVDSELFHPKRANLEMRARLSGGRPARPLLLTVSRLAAEKNVGFLADVVRQLPGVCLAVVGDGPERAALEQQVRGHRHIVSGLFEGRGIGNGLCLRRRLCLCFRYRNHGQRYPRSNGLRPRRRGASGRRDSELDEPRDHRLPLPTRRFARRAAANTCFAERRKSTLASWTVSSPRH